MLVNSMLKVLFIFTLHRIIEIFKILDYKKMNLIFIQLSILNQCGIKLMTLIIMCCFVMLFNTNFFTYAEFTTKKTEIYSVFLLS